MTARQRLREQRAEHTALGGLLHTAPDRKPLVVYRCAVQRSRGRSASCLMIEVFDTTFGPLLYRPASKVRPTAAELNARDEQMPAMGALLDDLRADAGGDLLANLAVCRHYVVDVSLEGLTAEVQRARTSREPVRRFLPDSDSPVVMVGRR